MILGATIDTTLSCEQQELSERNVATSKLFEVLRKGERRVLMRVATNEDRKILEARMRRLRTGKTINLILHILSCPVW